MIFDMMAVFIPPECNTSSTIVLSHLNFLTQGRMASQEEYESPNERKFLGFFTVFRSKNKNWITLRIAIFSSFQWKSLDTLVNQLIPKWRITDRKIWHYRNTRSMVRSLFEVYIICSYCFFFFRSLRRCEPIYLSNHLHKSFPVWIGVQTKETALKSVHPFGSHGATEGHRHQLMILKWLKWLSSRIANNHL